MPSKRPGFVRKVSQVREPRKHDFSWVHTQAAASRAIAQSERKRRSSGELCRVQSLRDLSGSPLIARREGSLCSTNEAWVGHGFLGGAAGIVGLAIVAACSASTSGSGDVNSSSLECSGPGACSCAATGESGKADTLECPASSLLWTFCCATEGYPAMGSCLCDVAGCSAPTDSLCQCGLLSSDGTLKGAAYDSDECQGYAGGTCCSTADGDCYCTSRSSCLAQTDSPIDQCTAYATLNGLACDTGAHRIFACFEVPDSGGHPDSGASMSGPQPQCTSMMTALDLVSIAGIGLAGIAPSET